MRRGDKKRALLGFVVVAIMLALVLGATSLHTTSFSPSTIHLGPTTITTATSSSGNTAYAVFIDSTDAHKTKARNNLTGRIDFTDTDPAAVVQSAIDSLAASGGTISLLPGTYVWGSVPALPKDLPDWLHIVGLGSNVTIQLTSQGPRAFDFHRTADYQTFRKIDIENLNIDGNNVGGRSHVVLGTNIDGTDEPRMNIEDITIRNITTRNVPVDPTTTNHRLNVHIDVWSKPGDQETHLTNILIENCDFNGGNAGIDIGGNGPGLIGVNVFMDNINIINCRHSGLVIPSQFFPSANIQLGGLGFGGHVHIADFYGEYSGDVGIELNAVNAVVENSTIVDPFNIGFYHINYNSNPPKDQQIVYRNCTTTIVASNLPGMGWAITSGSSSPVPLGTLVIDNCRFYSSSTGSGKNAEYYEGYAARVYSLRGMNQVTISNFTATIDGIQYSSSDEHRLSPIWLGSAGGERPDIHLSNVEVTVKGSRRSNAGTLLVTGIDVEGNIVIDFENVNMDVSVSNMSAYSITGISLGGVSATLHGTISRLTIHHLADDPYAAGIVIHGTNTLTIDGQLSIENCDFSNMTGGDAVRFEGNGNKNRVILSNNQYGNSTAATVARTFAVPVTKTVSSSTTSTSASLDLCHARVVTHSF